MNLIINYIEFRIVKIKLLVFFINSTIVSTLHERENRQKLTSVREKEKKKVKVAKNMLLFERI